MGLLWLLVALPIVEIALFIQVGGLIGVWATLGLVVLAFVLSMILGILAAYYAGSLLDRVVTVMARICSRLLTLKAGTP